VTTDLDTRQPSTGLAIRPGQEMWDDKQRAALAVLGIKNATNADLAVFMHYCRKTGLDPFSRQIYGIMRREKQGDQWVDKFTIQVGIDGFRVIRDRIAQRLGISVEYEDTIWYDDDGSAWTMWLWDRPPAACKVTVIKDGKRFPAVVRTAAYAATNKNGDMVAQWRTQPEHMIEKCAEAFALRRAFPHDLGGMYVDEEMASAPAPAAPQPVRVTAEEITGRPAAHVPPADTPSNQGPGREVYTEPSPTPAPPAGASAPTSGPANGQRAPSGPSKAAQAKLEDLMRRIPLGEAEDRAVFTAWVTGHPADETLTAADVRALTTILEDVEAAAEGDVAEAASQLWLQHRNATGASNG
jgi:phage recombination protein Bet